MVFLIALVFTVAGIAAIPLIVRSEASASSQTSSVIALALLWIAGILSGLMTLLTLAAVRLGHGHTHTLGARQEAYLRLFLELSWVLRSAGRGKGPETIEGLRLHVFDPRSESACFLPN